LSNFPESFRRNMKKFRFILLVSSRIGNKNLKFAKIYGTFSITEKLLIEPFSLLHYMIKSKNLQLLAKDKTITELSKLGIQKRIKSLDKLKKFLNHNPQGILLN